MATFSQISSLAELLKPAENEASDDENISYSSLHTNIQTPAHIGPPKKETSSQNEPVKNVSDIWNEDEVQVCDQFDETLDSRTAPEYEILFKQKVTSEDIFLGMSGRNPSTACCEDLTVKIHLPGTDYPSVQLNVTDTFLDCRTPKYKLGLYFPHHVDSKNGKAQWDSEKNLLTVSAPVIREYDFLNVGSRS